MVGYADKAATSVAGQYGIIIGLNGYINRLIERPLLLLLHVPLEPFDPSNSIVTVFKGSDNS